MEPTTPTKCVCEMQWEWAHVARASLDFYCATNTLQIDSLVQCTWSEAMLGTLILLFRIQMHITYSMFYNYSGRGRCTHTQQNTDRTFQFETINCFVECARPRQWYWWWCWWWFNEIYPFENGNVPLCLFYFIFHEISWRQQPKQQQQKQFNSNWYTMFCLTLSVSLPLSVCSIENTE